MKYVIHKRNTLGVQPLKMLRKGLNPPVSLLLFIITLPFKLLPGRLMRRLSKTQRLFINMVLASIMLVFGVWIASGLLNPSQTEAAWFNTSWLYRQTVPITNSGAALQNAQIPITIDTAALITAGKMRSDCRDIRVTAFNGNLLKHWVHQCNSATTRIYVWVPNLPASTSNLLLYYGNASANQNLEVKTGTDIYPGISCKTILDHNDSINGNAQYFIDPNAGVATDKFLAYCDMTTDSGGWTIVHSSNGTISQQGLTSDTEVAGDPFSNASSNFSNQKKQDASLVSSESLIKRSNGLWLKVSVPLFDANLTTASQHPHNTSVTLTANDGTTISTGVSGYSNYNNASGGDYGITTSVGFDHHSTSYYHLRSGCTSHYFYKYGTTYNVNTALGSWTQTVACGNNSTSMGAWYGAMRGTTTPTITNVTVSSPANEEQSITPVAYWAFNEGTGTVASSSGSSPIPASLYNSSWQQADQCIWGKCLSFNGSTSYADLGLHTVGPRIHGAPATTVSFWVNFKGTPTAGNTYEIFAVVNSTGGSIDSKFDENRKITVGGRSTSGDSFQNAVSTNALSLNTWYHVVGVLDYPNDQIRIYINGILDKTQSVTFGSNTYADSANGTLNDTIGNFEATSRYLKGSIDEVKLYPFAQSIAQIQSDFISRGSGKGSGAVLGASNQGNVSNGLVGHWKMDEAAVNTCTGGANDSCDSSGNGNDGAWNGNATASPSGKFGAALINDAGSSFTQVAASTSLQITDELTVCSWVNTWMTNMNGGIFEKTSNGSVNTGYLLFAEGTAYVWRINAVGPGLQTITSTSTLTTLQNKWSHICGTYSKSSGGLMRLYVNGKLERSSTISGAPSINAGSAVSFLGSLSGTYRYNGAIDEVRVYNRALSSEDVTQLYNFAPGPVANYNFEEGSGSNFNDTSGNNNNGTLNGTGARWAAGKYGKAGDFNGTNNYGSVTDPASGILDFGTSGNFTAMGWIYTRSTGGVYMAKMNSGSPATRVGWSLGTSNGFLGFNMGDGTNGITGQSSTAVPTNRWFHYAVTVNRTGNYILYLNGVPIRAATATTIGDISNSLAFAVGSESDHPTLVRETIDEVKIYNYVRTQGQIISDMNANHPLGGSPIGSQMGYWKFDEGKGTTTFDSSPQRVNGTITGANYTNDGKFGKALYFNGASYDTLGNISAFKTDNKTISFWANPTISPAATVIIFGNGAANYYVGLTTSNRLITSHSVAAGTQQTTISANNAVTINEWHYYAVSWTVVDSNVTVTMYKDGNQISSTSYTTGYSATYGSNFIIGALTSGANFYTGYLDEMKIYSGVLSPAEVRLDYNRGSSLNLGTLGVSSSDGKTASNSATTAYCVPGDTSTCAAPTAEWKFDEKTGAVANDSSGNANTATLVSTSWAQGKIGSALGFNGSTSYASVATSATTDMTTNDFTIQAWVKTSSATQQRIISKRSAGNIGYEMLLLSNGKIDYFIGDAGGFTFGGLSKGNVNDGRWHLLTIVFNRAGNAVSYIDGKQDATQSISTRNGSISNATSLHIGRYSVSSSQFFTGSIDQPTIYNYARTQAQIAYDYDRGKPVAWYKIDECQGSTFNDSAGGTVSAALTIGASGTQTSAGTCSTASTGWGNGATGKLNSSFRFDGTDDYAVINDTIYTQATSNISASLWVKPSALGSQLVNYPISKGIGGAASQGWAFGINGTNNSGCANAVGKVYLFTNNTFVCGSTISTGTWSHMVFTNDGTTTKIYINGVLAGSGAQTIQASVATNINIGRRSDANWYFNGQVDDVQIYNYTLTPNQVQGIMNQNSSVRFGPATGTP